MCVGHGPGRDDLGHAAWIKEAKAAGRPMPSSTRSKGPSGPLPDLPAFLSKLFDL
jgi:hypothetical protein